MKISIKRLIIWFAFLGTLIMTFSVLHNSDFAKIYSPAVANAMTMADRILFKVSSVIIYIMIGFGLFVELDYGGLKEKLPLFKTGKLAHHIAAWAIIIVTAIILSNVSASAMSPQFKKAYNEYNKTRIAEMKKKNG